MHTYIHIYTYIHIQTHRNTCKYIHIHVPHSYTHIHIHTPIVQEGSVMMSKLGLRSISFRHLCLTVYVLLTTCPCMWHFYQMCHWNSLGSQATVCHMRDAWSWHILALKRKVRQLTPPERADNLNSFTPESPEVCGRSLNRCWNMTSFWRLDQGGCRVIMCD